jgi:hypothetical protein
MISSAHFTKIILIITLSSLIAILFGCGTSKSKELNKRLEERHALSDSISNHSIDVGKVLNKAEAYLNSGYVTDADMIITDLLFYYKNLKDSVLTNKLVAISARISKVNNLTVRENINNSGLSNKYVVNADVIFAATSEGDFNIMMNCITSGDRQALGTMVANRQVKYLYRNDVVFLVTPKWKYYLVRPEGSSETLYVVGEQLKQSR